MVMYRQFEHSSSPPSDLLFCSSPRPSSRFPRLEPDQSTHIIDFSLLYNTRLYDLPNLWHRSGYQRPDTIGSFYLKSDPFDCFVCYSVSVIADKVVGAGEVIGEIVLGG
jgi:hypothetical protein